MLKQTIDAFTFLKNYKIKGANVIIIIQIYKTANFVHY